MTPSVSTTGSDGWSDDDVAWLIDAGVVASEGPTDDHPLRALTRTIATQYVEVIASLATAAFGGRSSEVRPQFLAAAGALRRLAEASEDQAMVAVLADADALIPTDVPRGRARDRFFKDLQAWVHRFADLLPDEERTRMKAVVDVDDSTESPFVQELLQVEGIGAKRMERLYCAGLFTVSAVCGASPLEIAAVTGMPLRLAERIVATAHRFEAERPRRVASSLLRSAHLTREALQSVRRDDPRRDEIVKAARTAMEQLAALLDTLESPAGKETP